MNRLRPSRVWARVGLTDATSTPERRFLHPSMEADGFDADVISDAVTAAIENDVAGLVFHNIFGNNADGSMAMDGWIRMEEAPALRRLRTTARHLQDQVARLRARNRLAVAYVGPPPAWWDRPLPDEQLRAQVDFSTLPLRAARFHTIIIDGTGAAEGDSLRARTLECADNFFNAGAGIEQMANSNFHYLRGRMSYTIVGRRRPDGTFGGGNCDPEDPDQDGIKPLAPCYQPLSEISGECLIADDGADEVLNTPAARARRCTAFLRLGLSPVIDWWEFAQRGLRPRAIVEAAEVPS